MKSISDPRLPHTTELPDEVAVEAVVIRKSMFLDPTLTGVSLDDASAESRAVAQEQQNAALNARFGMLYRENGPALSSTIGCPVPPPAEPPAEAALAGPLATPAEPDDQVQR